MADWKTRLAVTISGEGPDTLVTPIDSFSPSFSLNAEALHSLEATHIGCVYSPQAITFTMSVKAIGGAAAKLTELALKGTRFNISMQESDDGTDWSFTSVVLTDCIITSATPTAATISGAPVATFSGFSLQSSVTTKGTPPATVTIP